MEYITTEEQAKEYGGFLREIGAVLRGYEMGAGKSLQEMGIAIDEEAFIYYRYAFAHRETFSPLRVFADILLWFAGKEDGSNIPITIKKEMREWREGTWDL